MRLWDKDRWSSDDFLGEIAISLKGLSDGNPHDEWHQLSNEPKKTKDKNPNKPPGEIRIKLHYPIANQPVKETVVAPVPKTKMKMKSSSKKAKKLEDKYIIGKELGRYINDQYLNCLN